MAIQEVIVELNYLQTKGIISSYAIGGAVAAGVYTAPMSTEDVDVFVIFAGSKAHSLDALSPIYGALIPRGAKVSHAHLEIGGWPVRFLPGATNGLYRDATANARDLAVGGQTARFMGPEHLAAIALQTNRGKDLVRVLEFLKTDVMNQSLFHSLITKFGLTDEWTQFQSKFLAET